MANMELLQEIKTMSKAIRNGNADSGNAFLMGYLWATLTVKQQQEIADEFNLMMKDVPKKG